MKQKIKKQTEKSVENQGKPVNNAVSGSGIPAGSNDYLQYQKYTHAHLYYAAAVICLALFFMVVVQAIYTQVADLNLYLAAVYYLIAAILLALTRRCYRRGRGHYSY